MAENYWICEKCGHHNSMRNHRCSACHHKMTASEKSEAMRRATRADDFDRMMHRRFGDGESDVYTQERMASHRTRRQKNTIGGRLKEMGQDMAIDPRQPFGLKVVHVLVYALLFMAVAAFAYGLFVYVTNGYFDGLATAGSKLISSVVNIFSNTYNYFLNINFSNNAVVRVGSIIGGNLVKMITTIFSNIASLFGK